MVDTGLIYLVGVKACGKLTVLCHIAASFSIGNNDFNIIFSCGILRYQPVY